MQKRHPVPEVRLLNFTEEGREFRDF